LLLVKLVVTALCIKVNLVLLLVVAHCLVPSKLLVQAGALLTLRRLNAVFALTHSKKAASAAFLLGKRN
jgi:hypothetical protein